MEFKCKEIQDIIKTCRENGVTRLKIGELSVSFLPVESKTQGVATPTVEQLQTQKLYENEAFLEQERRVKQDELDNLRLLDPETYEDLVNRGELENVGEKSKGIES